MSSMDPLLAGAEEDRRAAREARLAAIRAKHAARGEEEDREANDQRTPTAIPSDEGNIAYPPPERVRIEAVDPSNLSEEKTVTTGELGIAGPWDTGDEELTVDPDNLIAIGNGFFAENWAGAVPLRSAVGDVVQTFNDLNSWAEDNAPLLKNVYSARDAAYSYMMAKARGDEDYEVRRASLPAMAAAIDDAIPKANVEEMSVPGHAIHSAMKFMSTMAAAWGPAAQVLTKYGWAAKQGSSIAPGAKIALDQMSKRGVVAAGAIQSAMANLALEAEGNLFNAFEAFGADTGILGEILATDEDDPELWNRLRNAVVDMPVGAMVDGVMLGVRALWRVHRAAAQDAAMKTAMEEAVERAAQNPVTNDDLMAALNARSGSVAERSEAAKRILEAQARLEGITPEEAIQAAKDLGRKIDRAINFDRITDDEGIDRGLRTVIGADFDANQEGRHVANYLGITEEEAATEVMGIGEILARADGEIWDGVKTTRLRNTLMYLAERTDELLEVAVRERTPESLWAWRRWKILTAAVTERALGLQAEHGRVLNVYKITADSAPVRKRFELENVLDYDGGLETLLKEADIEAAAKASGKPWAGRQASLPKTRSEVTADIAIRLAVGGMLWQTKTHVKNELDFLRSMIVEPLERGLAGARRAARGLPVDEGVESGEAFALFRGQFAAFRDAVRAAKYAWREGESTFGRAAGRKIEGPHGMDQSEFFEQFMLPDTNLFNKAVNGLLRLNDVSGRALFTVDEFNKQIAYGGEIYAQAVRQATQELRSNRMVGNLVDFDPMAPSLYVQTGDNAAGNIADNFAARVKYLQDNPSEIADLEAIGATNYRTFTDRIPDGKGKDILYKMRDWDNQFARYAMTAHVLTFVNTPTRAFSYQMERMFPGLGRLSKTYRQNIAAGGARADAAFGRMALGAMTFGAFLDLGMQGLGSPPRPTKDFELARRFEDAGGRWLAVYTGDEHGWVDLNMFDSIAPQAALAFSMADILRKKQFGPENELLVQDFTAAAVAISAELTINRLWFTGLRDSLKAVSGDLSGNALAAFLRRKAQAATPLSGAFKEAERIISPEVERQQGIPVASSVAGEGTGFDWLYAMMPTLSDMLPDAINLVGEPVNDAPGWGAWSTIGAPNVSQDNVHPIFVELDRIKLTLPQMKMTQTVEGAVDMDLSRFPRVFERLCKLAGNEVAHPVWGMTLSERLAALVSEGGSDIPMDAFYQHPDAGLSMKRKHIRKIVREYRELAKRELVREARDSEDPNMQEFYQEWASRSALGDPEGGTPFKPDPAPLIAPESTLNIGI